MFKLKINRPPCLAGITRYLGRSIPLMLAGLMLISLLSGCALTGTQGPTGNNVNPAGGIIAPLYNEDVVASLYERSIPAVVEIAVVVQPTINPLVPFQFNVPQRRGQGSGFFIDSEGHLLTNYHVIEDAVSVNVILHDGTRLPVEIIGTDPRNDMALLKVDADTARQIAFLPLADSDKVRPGQMAVALGSPFGLEGSITVGVVSGVERSLAGENMRAIVNVIQTDAAINPGNSGGPLLNSRGEVIGINTAMDSQGSGIGFAVASNMVKTRLPALLAGGEIKTPWLGIRGMKIDNELASTLNLPVEEGVYVIEVLKDSPAEKTGLKGDSNGTMAQEPAGDADVITAIDGRSVTMVEDILGYLNGLQPGDEVTLTLYRGGGKMDVKVVLDAWPDDTLVIEED